MDNKYLDYNGLSCLWDLINTFFIRKDMLATNDDIDNIFL